VEKLNLSSKSGLYVVAFCIMGMPLIILGLTRVLNMGEPINLSTIDWVWSAACLVSGFLLLLRLKIAWIISMIQIFAVAVVNLIQMMNAWGYEAVVQYNFQFLFSVSMLCSILLIAHYYKYPYLDRRDTVIYGIADRYKVKMKAIVNEKVFGEVVSASISGVLFRTEGELKLDGNKKLLLSIDELDLKSVPVEVSNQSGDEFRLKFGFLGIMKSLRLRKQLKKYPKQPN
jgi:hypothetical protein